jgi:hypothetical protein
MFAPLPATFLQQKYSTYGCKKMKNHKFGYGGIAVAFGSQ